MAVCPLCQHAQAVAGECEVCGRSLSGPGFAPVTFERLPGLEPTRLDETIPVPEGRLPDLEPTGHPAAEAAPEPFLALEPTRLPAVDVEVEAAPDVERTAVDGIPGDDATPRAETVVCRYCRTPARAGEVLCVRCGMKLSALEERPETPEESPPRRCPACGTLEAGPGDSCADCGARLRRL